MSVEGKRCRSLWTSIASFIGSTLLVTACVSTPPGVVNAPTTTATPSSKTSRDESTAGHGGPAACAKPWSPIGAAERAVVVCSSGVRREPFDEAGSMARAVVPALEPARERVCACASRVTPPPHIDIAVHTAPDQGRATVEIEDPEDDLDPTLGPDFIACFGGVAVTFEPFHLDACAGGENAVLVYPVRVELGS